MDVFQSFLHGEKTYWRMPPEYRKCDIAVQYRIVCLTCWSLDGGVICPGLLHTERRCWHSSHFGIAWQAKLMLLEPEEHHANITAFSHTVTIGTKCLGSVSKELRCGEWLYRWALLAAASSSGVAQSPNVPFASVALAPSASWRGSRGPEHARRWGRSWLGFWFGFTYLKSKSNH